MPLQYLIHCGQSVLLNFFDSQSWTKGLLQSIIILHYFVLCKLSGFMEDTCIRVQLINHYLHFLCYVSYICLLVACIACGFVWEDLCTHQKKPTAMQAGGSVIVFVPSCRGGRGGRGGWKGRGNSPYIHWHFYDPPFSPVLRAILLSMTPVQLNMQI